MATQNRNDRGDEREETVRRRIDRAVARTRFALLWEDLWPRLVPLLAVIGVFALVSWFGLWPGLPDWLRLAFLAVFAIAALAALLPVAGLRLPDRALAFARTERASGIPNRPATSFFDRLASRRPDARTAAIWEAHRERLLSGFAPLRTALPSPGVARRDPYGFRFLLLLLLAVAFIAAGGGWFDRMADAFRGAPGGAVAGVPLRIDAWAEPPAYTGRPSIFLTGTAVRTEGEAIAVPEGTEVFVRVAGADMGVADLVADGAVAETPRLGDGPREFQITLSEAGAVRVLTEGREAAAWTFQVIPDVPPAIAIVAGPERAAAGGLQVAYALEDDYGVAAAWGEMALAAPAEGARPLVGPPEYRLTVPRSAAANGEAVTVRDLSAHPWAGLEVLFTLVAEDAVGQRGASEARSVVIPGRAFINPVARALVAARQALALDANMADEVAATLDGLARGDLPGLGAFLVLRSAYHRLTLADGDAELRGVVDYLWDIAIAFEADPLADAADGLQAAADALRDALERNADPAEIALLTDALRNAMAQYIQALTANAQPFAAQPAAPVDTRIMRPDELERMLDQMQEFAAMGEIAAAEQLLNEFQRLMQNLEAANANPMQREFQPAADTIDDLGFLMQQQQRLMDETFALRQQQNAPLPPVRTPEEVERLAETLRDRRAGEAEEAERLAREQRQIHAALIGVLEGFLGQGVPALPLEEAEQAMQRAFGRLEQVRPDMAVGDQAEALAQMQAFAEELAEMMAEAAEGEGGDREGTQDPLGRPPRLEGPRYGDDVAVPEVIDRQLAREILELIRQRLEERDRPAGELDYLERLIEPF